MDRGCASQAAERGVPVGWEFEPRTPFNSPSEIFRIADDVTHASFGIIYDTTPAHNCVRLAAANWRLSRRRYRAGSWSSSGA